MKNNSPVNDWNKFIRDGDLEALSRVYFNYYNQLFTYGMKLTSDIQSVEDSIQNMLLNLIKSRGKISDVRNLTKYLLVSFRRQLLTEINKKRETIPTEDIPEEQFEYFKSPEDSGFNEKENLERIYSLVRDCISKLPPKQQEIIFLRFDKGMSYEEISEILNISVESSYKTVYRSIKTIRMEVEKIRGTGESMIFLFLCRTANLR